MAGPDFTSPTSGDDGQFPRYNHGAGTITWETPAGGSGGHPFLIVASSTSPAAWIAVADYACDGTADQTEINSAITACNTGGGGTVLLAPGLYYITAAVAMKSYVHLRGDSMRSTYLYANVGSSYTSIDAAGTGGVIEMANRKQTMTRVSDMTINGASYQKCIYDYTEATTQTGSDTNTGALNNWDAADAVHYYHDLYLTYPKDAGMHLQNFRCAIVDRCRFFDHGAGPSNTDGFYFQGVVDSFMSNLDCGAAYTGHAFNVGTVNSRFSNCKGWFGGKNGWLISGTRNQFSTCEAQDNTQYGFQITGSDNTFASCQADSNSYVAGSGSGTGVTYAGWKVSASRTTIVGCSAYDKNEGSRGLRQTYGFDVDSGVTGTMLHGRSHSNATSGYRDNSTGNSNDYVILGSHFLRKAASAAE